jgi:nucleoside-diphosphate kinase
MNQEEYTLSIIKPDANSRNLTNEINKFFTDEGLRIVAQKEITLTRAQAEEFYAEHKNRPFYNSLVEYMISGPVVVQVLAGKDAVAKNRQIMGATNPDNAEPGTIREKFGESLERNSVHGSDSLESAKREVYFFFTEDEVAQNK